MAVVSEHRVDCDGCGRMVAFEELTPVTMPDGEQVVCCPECEPHARATARNENSLDQRRDACDGCTGTYLTEDLEDVVLKDGTVLTCCPECAAEAPDGDDAAAGDGTAGTATGSKATTDSDRTATRWTATAESDRSATDDTDADETLCSQCREWVSEERFRITTIDDRTETLCADCKADAEEKGIVADVAMRETRAREVLGVDANASDGAIREAFHEQVKRAHPDRESGSKSAFKLVNEAYERLRVDD
ncbi:J domain-containing protein [Natrinema salsiterrestre]|uniref:DnaJ domain-containing protein n=1 Tax=Natrinema salsiterrestre TaxID=2950540 RepID=A0A9Q4Q0W4_9EURY|nr:J domain-containing protein [Natrinema salsiterrestre]MDF9747120.1 DnaJ domain-containing protein [Natrinema salsiterrestre]